MMHHEDGRFILNQERKMAKPRSSSREYPDKGLIKSVSGDVLKVAADSASPRPNFSVA